MNKKKDGEKNDKNRPDTNLKAVALLYNQESEAAPRIGAGGKGFIAEQIIKIARENGVPFYKDEDLCEILLQFEPDIIIPEDLYEAIARILVFIYKANNSYNA